MSAELAGVRLDLRGCAAAASGAEIAIEPHVTDVAARSTRWTTIAPSWPSDAPLIDTAEPWHKARLPAGRLDLL